MSIIPTHIKIYTSPHNSPQSALIGSSKQTTGLFALPDVDMPFRESDTVGGITDLEFNNRNDSDFDPRFLPKGSGHNNRKTPNHTVNHFILGDAPVLAPEQSDQTSFWGDVVLRSEAPLGSNEMTAIPQQNEFRDHHYTTQLFRASSLHLSNTDWEDYLNFSPNMRSSAGKLAATPNVPHCLPSQSTIGHGLNQPHRSRL